jgi:hypothetical protein
MSDYLKNLKDKVLYCLEHFPISRNDDAYLTWCIIYTYLPDEVKEIDGRWYLTKEAMYRVREDHVKRIRATVQNKRDESGNCTGSFLPTEPDVRRKRQLSEEDWRRFVGANPEVRTV